MWSARSTPYATIESAASILIETSALQLESTRDLHGKWGAGAIRFLTGAFIHSPSSSSKRPFAAGAPPLQASRSFC